MVYIYIGSDTKLQALYLLEDGCLDDIVEALGVSLKSITRWESNHEEYELASRPLDGAATWLFMDLDLSKARKSLRDDRRYTIVVT
jgi:hypothetical protein